MWVLDRPVYLLLLLILPVLMYVRHFWYRRGSRIIFPFTFCGGEGFRAPLTGRVVLLRISHLCFWVALVLLVIALAGPTRTVRERIFLTRGLDIMLVLDVSPTMAARDVQPVNRLEAARAVARRFVEHRENDQIGLVAFSLEAALRVPPTLNHDLVISSLEEVSLMEYGDGTAIGMALALASLHLHGSDGQEQVIILLTDGVNNAGEISPEAAAEVAGRSGIRIHTIGVGSEGEAEIEFRHPEDGRTYRGTVREGYDPESLRRIAELTGGRFFSAASGGSLEAVFNAIGTVETSERRVRVQVHRHPQHQQLLLLALILLVLDLVLRRLLIGSAP
ncbi:magnesium chelatase [Alkalispirochaeta sphaeroplastigenens]|uniref:Magnesium chelatase n=1 Tax=Alkalispirochaeta sphaeroplastigenens TaxID=1187066 RepID=A0A2S4JVP1_9SPIO|nr:VWA domain-containing protein [Alkalispirochaeta sphaeroplastigenens]POR03595.1 magnesium chelatase [Alkalispirochaeta sphaeroplastigenens]